MKDIDYLSNDVLDYLSNDVKVTRELYEGFHQAAIANTKPIIKRVIFNNPATIVFWIDGSKTVVRCQDGEAYDPEKGLAMAMCKKMLGNKYDYYNEFLHWLKKAPIDTNQMLYHSPEWARARRDVINSI